MSHHDHLSLKFAAAGPRGYLTLETEATMGARERQPMRP
jgi:hypothetical protein